MINNVQIYFKVNFKKTTFKHLFYTPLCSRSRRVNSHIKIFKHSNGIIVVKNIVEILSEPE